MKNLFLLLITLLLLTSCSNKTDTSKRKSNFDEIENNENIHQEDLSGLFITPEDSMNVKQKELRQKMTTLMKEKIKLENGCIVNIATKKDFEEQGIPATYYYLFQESIDDLNKAIEKGGVDVQKLYEEMLKGIPES